MAATISINSKLVKAGNPPKLIVISVKAISSKIAVVKDVYNYVTKAALSATPSAVSQSIIKGSTLVAV